MRHHQRAASHSFALELKAGEATPPRSICGPRPTVTLLHSPPLSALCRPYCGHVPLTHRSSHVPLLLQESSSGPPLLSSCNALAHWAASREALLVDGTSPSAWPSRRARRSRAPSAGCFQMAWREDNEPEPAAWPAPMLGPTTAPRRRLPAAAGGRDGRLARCIRFSCNWVPRGRPQCGLHKGVEPRARDRASAGGGPGGVEVERVVCGHRLSSARPRDDAECVPMRLTHGS